MRREYVVFCLDMLRYEREGKFGYFLHEADYLLLSLADNVHDGNITVAEAFEVLQPYVDDPQAENQSIREGIRTLKEGWSFEDAQKWVQILYGDSFDFPGYDDVLQDQPFTHIFQDEAYSVAYELGISDVGYFGFSGSTGPIFSVESPEALEELRKVMAGKYKNVVKEDLNEYAPASPPSPEETKRFIERHRVS
jgi:hypothetical protein